MLFQLQDLTFRYAPSAEPVFASFSLDIPFGLTVIKGPSGGGKSTLLKLLAGYLTPQRGKVLTRHQRAPDRQFRRRDAGFVFQQFNLLPGASVRRNLEIAGLVSGLEPGAIASGIEQWLGRLGIPQFADTAVEKLSGGQLQRAALARALAKSPSVLLLDEPTSGLDDASTAVIAEVVLSWSAAGRDAVVSTHDPRLTEALQPANAVALAEISG